MCRVTCRGKVATVYSCEAPSLPPPWVFGARPSSGLGAQILLVESRRVAILSSPSSEVRGVGGSSDIVALSKARSELFKADELELGRDLADELMVG